MPYYSTSDVTMLLARCRYERDADALAIVRQLAANAGYREGDDGRIYPYWNSRHACATDWDHFVRHFADYWSVTCALANRSHSAEQAEVLAYREDENYEQCRGCERWYDYTAYGHWCPRCTTCDGCYAATSDNSGVTAINGDTLCADCLDRFYWQCDGCDSYNSNNRSTCQNGCDEPDEPDELDLCTCALCQQNRAYHGGSPAVIHSYSYKPLPVFYGDGPLYLGAEIEVDIMNSESVASYAAQRFGDVVYFKYDGSVQGFEIVTHPMSYTWAMENFAWDTFPEIAERGGQTHSGTGIHVHVSRAGFTSELHQYRWMKFVYRNQRNVQRLARRSDNSWCSFTDSDRRRIKAYVKGAYPDSRYRAINTENEHTYELRVFRSSLQPQQIKAALGFAAASVEYTRTLTAHDVVTAQGWDWGPFVGWLQDRPEYTPLRTELEGLSCVS